MATRVVKIQAQSIGADSGPFTISDDVLGVLDSNVPRTSILGGYNVNSDTTATQITITSTGPCNDTVSIPVDFVVCPTGPTPTVEWYQLQRCDDLTYTTSASYNIGTFALNDRVTDLNGIVYVVTLVYSSNPGGAQLQIINTGLDGCPSTPPPPEDCRQNIVINVTDTGNIKYYNCDTDTTEYQFIGTTGNVTLTNCITPSSLSPGFPLADLASYTVVNNGVPCGGTPPPPPTYYYYSGLLCGGSIMEYFRSPISNLADQNVIVRAWCAICGGGSEQCFDNISPSLVVNTNDVIATYSDCVQCQGNTSLVTSVFGYMEPCIGGTIDDYMGVQVYLDSPVTVDTTFDVQVNYVYPGNACSNFNNTQYFQIVIPAGESGSTFSACQNGPYFPGGAVICSACIAYCSNPNVDLGGFAC